MKKRRWLALLLCLVMAFSVEMPQVYAATTIGENAMTEIPGTTKVEKDYDETFLSVTGFAAEGVQDRSQYYDEYVANGYKDTENYVVVDEDYYADSNDNRITVADYEALSDVEKANYELVTSEEQFCKGVSHARVVELRVDLELGWKYLENNGIANYGVVNPVTDYDKGNEPITSPVLMEVGVSSLTVSSHMTIFSPNGSMIEHAGFSLNDVEDVVIRNIRLQGLFEWDDVPQDMDSASPGGRKRYGWCYISCNNAQGIWIDHCTLGYAFDGNVDLKNDAQVSITWSQIGVQDTTKGTYTGTDADYETGCDLWKCIVYMENQYQAGNGFKIYKILRDNGATMDQIFAYACMHSKVHLVGSGEDDYETNPLNAITLAYNQYHDTAQRIPMVRQGNGHVFNCYFNSEDYLNACYGNSDFRAALSKVSAAGYSTYGLNRAMDSRDGASIGVDTCVWDGFSQPIIGNQMVDSGRFKNAINYLLIVNSSIRNNGSEDVYVGSNYDYNGANKFITTNDWKASGTTYIENKHFQWSEWKKMTKTASEASEDVYYVPESLVVNMADGEFYKNYYIGREELGYDYQTFPLADVKAVTDANSGAGKVTLDKAGEWTKLYYGLEADEHTVNFEDSHGTFDGAKTVVYTDNETLGELPVPVRTGYEFLGWYEGTLQEVDGTYKIVYSDTPVTKDTVVTEDMNLYAVWTVETYTLSFDTMGGSEIASIENISYGTTITAAGGFPADPTRDGFTFQGWYNSFTPETGYGAKVYANSVINADTTLYAKWRPTKVDVIFNTNGGSEVATIEDVTYNTAVTLPEAPTKDGYEFAGWYYDEALTKEFTEATKIVEKLSLDLNLYGSLTLYAKWTEVSEVTLSFETNGGTTAEAITVVPGEAVGELPIPTKAEYVFAGWYTDDTYTTEFTTASAIDVDTTVYAKWAAKGDMNQDNLVNANDALMILKYAANMLGEDEVTELKLKQADVEGTDGKVNANDALAILKYVANIITGFDS